MTLDFLAELPVLFFHTGPASSRHAVGQRNCLRARWQRGRDGRLERRWYRTDSEDSLL